MAVLKLENELINPFVNTTWCQKKKNVRIKSDILPTSAILLNISDWFRMTGLGVFHL